MNPESPIILAVDTTNLNEVEKLLEATSPYIGVYKFGLEFYLKFGSAVLRELQSAFEFRLFLDLKLHDIPNTVSKAAVAVSDLDPFILTVHAAGGSAMVSAASKALPETKVAAVTILTSLEQDDLDRMGFDANISDLVLALARSSIDAGAQAIVTSPHEVSLLKSRFPDTLMITPGIRGAEDPNGDQNRVLTPREAIENGSDFLVIGRPITANASPSDAAKRILDSLH